MYMVVLGVVLNLELEWGILMEWGKWCLAPFSQRLCCPCTALGAVTAHGMQVVCVVCLFASLRCFGELMS